MKSYASILLQLRCSCSPLSWAFEGGLGARSGTGEGEPNGSAKQVPRLQVQAGKLNFNKPLIEIGVM
jgi:hypothetical protein